MMINHVKLQFMILSKTAGNHTIEILVLKDSFIKISETAWANH